MADNSLSAWIKPSIHSELWAGGGGGGFGPAPFSAPNATSLIEKNGMLAPTLQLKGQPDVANTLDTSALGELQKEGMAAPGTSAWEQMMLGSQGLNEANQRDSANANAASGLTGAYSDLATHGGLSTGSRERLAKGGMTNLAEAKQQVARQGTLDRLGIGTQAEQNRLGILGALPGQQTQAASFNAGLAQNNRDYSTNVANTNISNSLAEQGREDQYKQQNYTDQMQDWAAMNAANATAKGGKGGGK